TRSSFFPTKNQGLEWMSSNPRMQIAVEIKATQAKSVAFRSQPEHTIAIKILPNGTFEEIFNGPGNLVWQQFDGKPLPSNGQYQISLNKLKELNKQVDKSQRILRVTQ
ncbi:hypothetical protein Q7I15_18920, partial [Aeromonas veronii]|uniref:DUF6998 domain-containing protein n=1 Tax=Aeromonas veronii TaxID=654 RepID=UPI0030074687